MGLKKINLSNPILTNMVVSALYHRPFKLDNRASNGEFFYEKEVFPAALISRWAPAHVALFHSGALLCTGIKDWKQYHEIIRDLDSYLSSSS